MGGAAKEPANLDALSKMSEKAFSIGEPSMQAAMDMLYNAINTGGVEARSGVYSQAAEKSMQASSQAQQAMSEDFARTGTAGTPFAQQIMGSMMQQGAQQAAMIPTQMANEDYWKVLSLFFPGAGSSMGQGIQGQGQAASVEAQRMQAMTQMMSSMYGSTAGMFDISKTLSSRELKKDITALDSFECLDKICALQGVSYKWKRNHRPDAGVIAEAVREVLPDASVDIQGYAGVSPLALIGYLIESVKALQKQIDQLQNSKEA